MLLAVLLALFVWPADFDLHAKGTLEPVDRRDVFAGVDGVVVQIGETDHAIEHGAVVHKGNCSLGSATPTSRWPRPTSRASGSWPGAGPRPAAPADEPRLRPEEQVAGCTASWPRPRRSCSSLECAVEDLQGRRWRTWRSAARSTARS